jgi:hypothetical protein
MMLNLYSQFMNAGAGVSIDWQQQFRAIVRALAIFCVDDPFLRDKFFVSVGGRDTRYLGELYEIERKRALSLPVPVAGVQYNTELLAAAAAKMKIADHRHTPGLLYVSDRFNQNSERFASCVQSVASLFDDGSASGGSRCSEQSLELCAYTLIVLLNLFLSLKRACQSSARQYLTEQTRFFGTEEFAAKTLSVCAKLPPVYSIQIQNHAEIALFEKTGRVSKI